MESMKISKSKERALWAGRVGGHGGKVGLALYLVLRQSKQAPASQEW